ncbi:hypothetical protein Tsubulata_026334 [Turnera subulata]|uniref:Poly(A) RNA polymerase mitochondrial-like central palm domain-containing protein n=1 Tax=Turnera subulata TaxID=218843 RepID=A0A9Q0F5A4_9ROSI|nr:hypothetical protein Tsubulata_026334 [Turnera subulata]
MNAYSLLEPTLKDILDCVKPLRDDWVARFRIIGELQDIVNSVESLREGWRRLKFIPNARIPILKFESNWPSISCDVSIDNFQGLMKSKFLFWINDIDRRFRDMVLLVKEWAKAHNMNNPKAGSFNSYSLSLLVVFHFQTCVPPILPPLKDMYPRNAADDLKGIRADAERYIGELCAANISKFKSDKSRAINHSSLSELFISFLAKFSDISVKASELGICPFTAQWEEIRGNMRWLPRTYALFIEDPFEQPENTARAVSAGNLIRMNEAIQTTYRMLVSANRNPSSLLPALVGPQVSRYISGSPINHPSLTVGNHIATHPQMSKSVYLPPQAQHHIHNVRQQRHSGNSTKQGHGSRLNNSTRKQPAQQAQSQVQAIWRPKFSNV